MTRDTALNRIERLAKHIVINGWSARVELCGRWLYITGNTKTHKDTLKACGCKYAPKKSADCWTWHYAKDDTYRGRRRFKNMGEIRAKYGSETYKQAEEQMMLAGA